MITITLSEKDAGQLCYTLESGMERLGRVGILTNWSIAVPFARKVSEAVNRQQDEKYLELLKSHAGGLAFAFGESSVGVEKK